MLNVRLLITVLLFFQHVTSQELCSQNKVNRTCVCRTITDKAENFAVKVADCSGIYLENFPSPSQILNNKLNLLDLSHNEIKKLDEAGEKLISEDLQTLDLSYNAIDHIDKEFFKGFPNLRRLNLRNNKLTSLDSQDIFQNLNKLRQLDLSFNYLKIISDNIFTSLTQLQNLDLSYNDESLGATFLESQTFLAEKLGLQANITHLTLDHLGLTDIPNTYFTTYEQLKYLSLADNLFENVPRFPYSVEYLDLSGTQITVLEAKHLDYHLLKVFKLNRLKNLHTIEQLAFYNLQSLQELYITDCHKLREFGALIFGALTKSTSLTLRKLSLARNNLQTLNQTFKFIFDQLNHLDLRDNPWNCDCDLLWLKDIDNIYQSELVQCYLPMYLRSNEVMNVTDDELPKCFPGKYGKMTHRILIPILILLIIILSGLIGYLIYYAPSWYTNRSFGPQSPYNYARTEED